MDLHKVIIPKQILVLTSFAFLLNFVYLVWSDSRFSLYTIWNIILAIIPFFISYHLLQYSKRGKNNILVYVIGSILWLLFLPNAPYLVTDIIHVGKSIGVPLWLDSLTLFCSAWVGMLLAIHSLSFMEKLFREKFSKHFATFLIMISILLSSFGMYIGRFVRLSSWDLLVHPRGVFDNIYSAFYNPINYQEAYAFILLFFSFILVSFYAWKFTQDKELKL